MACDARILHHQVCYVLRAYIETENNGPIMMSIDFWTGNKSDGEMEICRIVMAQVAITGARAHSIIVIQCRLVSITVGVPTKYLPAIDGILNGLV